MPKGTIGKQYKGKVARKLTYGQDRSHGDAVAIDAGGPSDRSGTFELELAAYEGKTRLTPRKISNILDILDRVEQDDEIADMIEETENLEIGPAVDTGDEESVERGESVEGVEQQDSGEDGEMGEAMISEGDALGDTSILSIDSSVLGVSVIRSPRKGRHYDSAEDEVSADEMPAIHDFEGFEATNEAVAEMLESDYSPPGSEDDSGGEHAAGMTRAHSRRMRRRRAARAMGGEQRRSRPRSSRSRRPGRAHRRRGRRGWVGSQSSSRSRSDIGDQEEEDAAAAGDVEEEGESTDDEG